MARPKYRLTEKAYIDDILYDPESPRLARRPEEITDESPEQFRPLFVEWDGEPAHYMAPANEEAKAMMKKFPPRSGSGALDAFTVVGTKGAKDIMDVLADRDRNEAAVQARMPVKTEAQIRAQIRAEVRAELEAEMAERPAETKAPKKANKR